jgi:uncharacterized protein
MSVEFEWDPHKADTNQRKHGVLFVDAVAVFSDPFVLIEQDRIEEGEYRWRAIGYADDVLMLFVAHTSLFESDGGESIRIISARRANASERKRYANQAS